MFPHSVTLYNVETQQDAEFRETVVNHTTILRGVLLTASQAVSKGASEGADAVSLYIPFSVEAVDGETGEAKKYAAPAAYKALEDKIGHWTLEPSRSCFFVKGEVVEAGSMQEIEAAHDDVYAVTRADVRDYGGDMQHFEVGGR